MSGIQERSFPVSRKQHIERLGEVEDEPRLVFLCVSYNPSFDRKDAVLFSFVAMLSFRGGKDCENRRSSDSARD